MQRKGGAWAGFCTGSSGKAGATEDRLVRGQDQETGASALDQKAERRSYRGNLNLRGELDRQM